MLKIACRFLVKNYSIFVPILAFIVVFGTFRTKNKKIQRQESELTAALEDNKKLLQDVKRVETVLDFARTDIRRLSELNHSDSVSFAKQVAGMQSVIAQVRAKAKREKEADAELIVELRKGLPPRECYNMFGKVVTCKD